MRIRDHLATKIIVKDVGAIINRPRAVNDRPYKGMIMRIRDHLATKLS